MTRAELHQVPGVSPESAKAFAAYLRTQIPRKRGVADATGLINHEGRMSGYLDAIDDLLDATAPEAKTKPTSQARPYDQPFSSTNPNQR